MVGVDVEFFDKVIDFVPLIVTDLSAVLSVTPLVVVEAVAVLSILPASTSACVTVWVAVQVHVAPGARLVVEDSVPDWLGTAPLTLLVQVVKVTFGSLIFTPASVTSPVLVTTSS